MVATAALMVTLAGRQVCAQEADPNPGALTMTGNVDFLNRYMFRGIRQNSTGVVIWPSFDLGIAAFSGTGGLKSTTINVGTWNSLHTGDTGSYGPSGKLWYESDFYTTLGLGFGKGISFATTYTAYTSPNNSYSTVKELMFKLSVDDSAYLGKAAVKPYVILAQEFSAEADGLTNGQADGGGNAGTYMEIGAAPGYTASRASLAVPVKVGFSLSDYYQLNTGTAAAPIYADNKFGYFSIAGIVTVPLGGTTGFGAWNVHGGVEYQALGETTKAFNGGDSSRVIGSVGIGFSY